MKINHTIFTILILLAAAAAFVADQFLPGVGAPGFFTMGAVVATLTKYSAAADNNSFAGKGIKAFTQVYASTSAPVLKAGAKEQHVCYAQLTGAMTINADVSNLSQFDKVIFYFDTDGTQRIVTFGTGFLSSGTVTIPASKGAICIGYYDGVAIRIASREIYA
jgi:hypothetical protein